MSDDLGKDIQASVEEAREDVKLEAEAQRLARVMLAETRRVVHTEYAEKLIGELTDAKYDVERDIVERLTSFFYLLMRDKLPVGDVNEVVKEVLTADTCVFSDDVLRLKAESIASMIACGEYTVTQKKAYIVDPDGEKGND